MRKERSAVGMGPASLWSLKPCVFRHFSAYSQAFYDSNKDNENSRSASKKG